MVESLAPQADARACRSSECRISAYLKARNAGIAARIECAVSNKISIGKWKGWLTPTPRTSSKRAISLAESRANPTSCPARLLERIAPLHARSGGVKAGGVQTAAAESYRLYLPHWNRFRKPPPDRAAEKGSVAVHGHCEATLTWAPRRSSTARRPRAGAKNGSPVHDREKRDPRGLLLVHVHPRAVSGACPEALRKQAGAAARLEE